VKKSWRVMPPTRADVATAKLTSECAARGHAFLPVGVPAVTGTITGPDGQQLRTQRTACQDCATVRILTWQEPERPAAEPGQPAQPGRRVARAAIVSYQPPDPGDIPGIASLAASVTDDEIDAAWEQAGYAGPLTGPGDAAAVSATTAELTLSVQAWQFYLLDDEEQPDTIVPVPRDAVSAGIIETVPGATIAWTGLRQGSIGLTVSVTPEDPGARLRDYEDVAEISHRSTTGRLRLAGLSRTLYTFPLLSGYGDYRLRYHVRGADAAHSAPGDTGGPAGHYLLQVWPAPRTGPVVLQAGSGWASARAITRAALPEPRVRPATPVTGMPLTLSIPLAPRPRPGMPG
jgi:hypothetical protein